MNSAIPNGEGISTTSVNGLRRRGGGSANLTGSARTTRPGGGDVDGHRAWHPDTWWYQNNRAWMAQHHREWIGDLDNRRVWRDVNWWAQKDPKLALQRHPQWAGPLRKSVEAQHVEYLTMVQRQHAGEQKAFERQHAREQQNGYQAH